MIILLGMNEGDLRKKLSPEEYRVTQEKETEAPFSGKYNNHGKQGLYRCTVCGKPLFSSETKFDSGTGWPSFTSPQGERSVEERRDTSHGMDRTEIICKNCGAHLGHLFKDGPSENTCRYCINSASLKFSKNNERM